ncbi:MAG TPA: hypothetical protein DD727_04930 [Clostridiales bacterium]|nr:hypothetical protein [Clostridiales bacterium]
MKKLMAVSLLIFMLAMTVSGCKSGTSASTTAKAGITSGKASTVSATVAKTTAKSTAVTTTGASGEVITEGPGEEQPGGGFPQEETGTGGESSGGLNSDDGPFFGLKFSPAGMDLGGRTMIFSERGSAFPPKGDGVLKNEVWWARKEKAEKLFNVKIENKATSGGGLVAYNEELSANFMAGLKFADRIFEVSWFVIPKYIKMGMALPLDQYIDYDHPKWATQKAAFRYIDGLHYGMSETVMRFNIQFTIYNKTILNNEGLEDILSVYKKGQWNWETFADYCQKTTRDLDGDGILDQYSIDAGHLIDGLLNSNGASKIAMEENKFSIGLYNPAALQAMNFFRELVFVNRVTCPDFSWLGTGKQAMIFADSSLNNNLKNKFKLDVGTAPLPKGPAVQEETIFAPYISFNFVYAYTDFKPEEVIAVHMFRQFNDPNDPSTYIDDFESFAGDAAVSGARRSYITDEEVDFWYKYTTNPKNLMVDYCVTQTTLPGFGNVYKVINDGIFTPLKNGESPSYALERIRSSIEIELNNYLR